MSVQQALILVPKKCRGPWCPRCGKAYWGKVLARMQPHFGLFKNARLLTLTIDPRNWPTHTNRIGRYRYFKSICVLAKRDMTLMQKKIEPKRIQFNSLGRIFR